MKQLSKVIFITLAVVAMSACVPNAAKPKLNKTDQQQFASAARPFQGQTIYRKALDQMGRAINSNVPVNKIVQSKPIGNSAGGNELPVNMTNIMINSVSQFAGRNFTVVPYDPDFIINDFNTGGAGSRMIPELIIGGSITEFDKDISATSESIDLDLLIGGGKTETDFGFGASSSRKMSRLVLDLHLLDYSTHAVIPGATISNTIHVLEIEKDRDYGFAVYGSGMGIDGRIKHAQGFHRAVRTLVEYSVLQLFGKYYALPYWDWIGMEYADPAVLRRMTSNFGSRPRRQQIQDIQLALSKFNLGEVTDPISGQSYSSPPEDGILDPVTDSFIQKYRQRFKKQLSDKDLAGLYRSLLGHSKQQRLKAVASEEGNSTSIEKKFKDRYSTSLRVYPNLNQ